jgi:oligopeptide/dipeptide ABC transporter ATP-binding protein
MTPPLLDVRDLERHYSRAAAPAIKAVDGVSLALEAGTVLGIVGESGSGKSSLARLVMALDRPSAGTVLFEGHDLFAAPAGVLKGLRRGFQMVFQDPIGSLDPRRTIGWSVAEPLHLDRGLSRADRRARVAEGLISVGLRPEDAARLPHHFSGGQRQRIAIARAIVGHPKLLVADEPVSALDPSVQAQILNLMQDLRRQRGIAILLITHSLAVAETLADRIGVMHRGRLVETGPAAKVLARPLHPYTRRLVEADLSLDGPDRHARRAMRSAGVSPPVADIDPGWGCAYRGLCPVAIDRCRTDVPRLRVIEDGHSVACHGARMG